MTDTPAKPVLLTGASGALGRVLAKSLAAEGWTLRMTDIAPFPDPLPAGATFTRIDLNDGRLLQTLDSQADRHFYGHGVWHKDGEWLYATENDTTDPGRGVLGVYRFDGNQLSHTGEIYPSGFLPLHCGRFPLDSVVRTYQEAALFKALRDTSRPAGKCGACEYRELCGGSRARAYGLTGDPLASDPDCAYQPPRWAGAVPA